MALRGARVRSMERTTTTIDPLDGGVGGDAATHRITLAARRVSGPRLTPHVILDQIDK